MSSWISSQVKGVDSWEGLPVFTVFCAGLDIRGTLIPTAGESAGGRVEAWPQQSVDALVADAGKPWQLPAGAAL